MGRSVAEFVLLGRTKDWVFATSRGVAAELGMRVETPSPDRLEARRGSIWWTGTRNLVVMTRDVAGGVGVHVETWAGGLTELSADPARFVGLVPRRDAWRIASTLVARLGAHPEQVFRHF